MLSVLLQPNNHIVLHDIILHNALKIKNTQKKCEMYILTA